MIRPPEFRDGAPCWAELCTPDLAGAQRFYASLLDWSFGPPRPQFNDHVDIDHHGASVAGMMQLQAQRPAWTVFLQSSDIDATGREIAAAGGKMLMDRHPVGSLGFSAVAADPSGASFGLWQPAEHRGAERFDAPGGMAWAELYTRDGARADAFYRAALGHAATKVENDKGLDYAEYAVEGQVVCGRLVMTKNWGEVPPHWLTYFGVADTDAAIAKLPAIEGKLIHGPFPTPMGPAALVTDPYGALFAIVQRPAPKS